MMKKSMAAICMTLVILIFSTGLVWAGNGKLGRQAGVNNGPTGDGVSFLAYEDPSDVEIEALTFMVQEEKLARDVYTALYQAWGIPAFSNIAKAEQRHMDAIISLLNKYGLQNPVDGFDIGVFVNQDLQTLYHHLIDSGQESQEQALLVGATIEDVDIFDLRNELQVVDNEDIIKVFENLLKGSENHLRAFHSLLVIYGYDPYTASNFLTQEEIAEILAATRIKGHKNSSNGGAITQGDRLPRQNRMIDTDGDGICDFLQ
jgi:hypothetical protein